MSNEISFTKMSLGELFSTYDLIEIPKLQRDYAQGRKPEKNKRERFLDALKNQFEQDFSLNLDFIYGSTDIEVGQKKFLPLDGQQRLTTLFLLHWYFALKDDLWDEFVQIFVSKRLEVRTSKFTYNVRPSSKSFFDHLCRVGNDKTEKRLIITRNIVISKWLKNQFWFRKKWLFDPTIKSCLVMLDAMHEKFLKVPNGFQQLVHNKIITFDVLSLEEYGLSEELYIKMNARGKMLSRFENLKVGLSVHITNLIEEKKLFLPWKKKHFEEQIDRDWTDLFWNWRPESNLDSTRVKVMGFDEEFMNFFHACNVGWALEEQNNLKDHTKENFKTVQEILLKTYYFGFWEYSDAGLLTPSFLEKWITLLDILSKQLDIKSKRYQYFLQDDGEFHYFPEKVNSNPKMRTQTVIEKILYGVFIRKDKPPLNLTERLLWYAYSSYLVVFTPDPIKDRSHFQDWMRIISNLSKNVSDYYKFEFFSSSTEKIDEWLRQMQANNQTFSQLLAQGDIQGETVLGGFTRAQLREEHLKAKLLCEHSADNIQWWDLISNAEKHPYFNGQIEFLLDFCGILDHVLEMEKWSIKEDELFRQQFHSYYNKMVALFPVDPKKSTIFAPPTSNRKPFANSKRHLLELALLSKGNYLLRYGNGYRYSASAVYEQYTWKRFLSTQGNQKYETSHLLTRDFFKDLVDDKLFSIQNIETSLQQIAKNKEINTKKERDPSGRNLFSKAYLWREGLLNFPKILDDCPAYLLGIGRHDPYPMTQFLILSHKSHHTADQEIYSTLLFYLLESNPLISVRREQNTNLEIIIEKENTIQIYCTGGYPVIGEEPHLYFFEKREKPLLTDADYTRIFEESEKNGLGLDWGDEIHNSKSLSMPVSKVFTTSENSLVLRPEIIYFLGLL